MCEIFLSCLATTPQRRLAAHWLGGCWAFAGDYDVVFEAVVQAGEFRALFALLRPDLFCSLELLRIRLLDRPFGRLF